VTKEYGVLGPSGRATRSTFVIGKDGKIKKIYRAVKNPGDHPKEVYEYVKANLGEK
jgi:peroxiredoxin